MKIPQGMTQPEALARLYNRAQTQGMGRLQYTPAPMTLAEAGDLPPQLDYVRGRVMKINVAAMMAGEDEWERLYERDNGPGSASEALTDPQYAPAK